MHLFRNDYSEGAHPKVMEALAKAGTSQYVGYTCDQRCDRARRMILDACGLTAAEADVQFVPGGTATNIIALCGLLDRPYDAVVCTPDGHINTHETGALEAVGHKVLPTTDSDGFVTVPAVDAIVRGNAAFGNHMTRPRAIYISDTTELAGVYSAERFHQIADYAHGHDMKLYLDGARLGSALTCPDNDLALQDIARTADAFYLGGTKNGLLFGEALVIRDPQLRADAPWLMKRHANLLAKGFLMGIQFEAAFEDGLYWECAKNANAQAARLREGLVALGWKQWKPSTTNQLFFEVDAALAAALEDACGCEEFFDLGATKVVRFVTSWATTAADVDEVLAFAAARVGA